MTEFCSAIVTEFEEWADEEQLRVTAVRVTAGPGTTVTQRHSRTRPRCDAELFLVAASVELCDNG
jgi:hypothetical protein